MDSYHGKMLKYKSCLKVQNKKNIMREKWNYVSTPSVLQFLLPKTTIYGIVHIKRRPAGCSAYHVCVHLPKTYPIILGT